MSYTFNTAITDDITAIVTSYGASGQHTFIGGWWYPTTLTAGRGYYCFGTLHQMKVHTTTSELSLVFDRVTTDATDVTSGAGIVINKWHYIAVVSTNSGGAETKVVWIGDSETPPKQITTIPIAGSGAGVAATTFTVGNLGQSASTAFQGDIGDITFITQTSASIINQIPFGALANTFGIERIYNKFVVPHWLGEPLPVDVVSSGSAEHVRWNMANPIVQAQRICYVAANGLAAAYLDPTVDGAVLSQNRPPRALRTPWPHVPTLVRR